MIPSQPHWSIICIKRGRAGLKPLIDEAVSLHTQLLNMDNIGAMPAPSDEAGAMQMGGMAAWPGDPQGGMGGGDGSGDSVAAGADVAAQARMRRETRLTSLLNSVVEGFTVD